MKICQGCGQAKPLCEFYMHKKKARSRCKMCIKKEARDYSVKNKARTLAVAKANYNRSHLAKRIRQLERAGVDREELIRFLRKAKTVCEICGTHQSDLPVRLSIDHCHVTFKVRGMLCGKCNQALGLLRDSVFLLRKAIRYLNRSRKNA